MSLATLGACGGTSEPRALESEVGSTRLGDDAVATSRINASRSRADSAATSGSVEASRVRSASLSVGQASEEAASVSVVAASISDSMSGRSSQLAALNSTAQGAIIVPVQRATMTSLAASTRVDSTSRSSAPAAVKPSQLAAASTAKASVLASSAPVSAGARPAGGVAPVVLGPHQSLVATAAVPKVTVYSSPGGKVATTLRSPQSSGFPLVFLALQDTGDWLQVYLPVRPNGSVGWIAKRDVSLTFHDYRILIELGAHKLTVYRAGAVVMSESIGVGTASAPTPGGIVDTKEVLKVPSPGGPYGPYAYGLSGFSDVYETFGSGPGTIGIHGTNDPSSIGRDVSHGCIRLNNSAITKMVNTLPIGVPVEIRA